jgi:hypothetical protein
MRADTPAKSAEIDLAGEIAAMGTLLQFKALDRKAAARAVATGRCEIVIFPGVRIERHDDSGSLDLGARLTEAAGSGPFDGVGGSRRPRKTS